jgi:hypothetical protein
MIPLLALLALGPTFEKHVLDTRFISEGVAVADLNRDKKPDILAGNVWYQAPTWAKHEITPVPTLDPKTQYSNCFHNWAADLNKDGYPDQILIGMPGEKATWRENPGVVPPSQAASPWKEHLIWHSACNESPLYEDLFRNGRRVLIMGTDDQYLAWFEPGKDPYKPWIPHRISEDKGVGSQRYSHGLGVGDADNDGYLDVITTGGYYVSPLKSQKGFAADEVPEGTWKFVKAELGPDCAHMLTTSKDSRSARPLNFILTTSAHARGVWCFAPSTFEREKLDDTISETHAAALMIINGKTNLITGKRKWAHPPGVDVGSEEPSWLVRYEYSSGRWTRYLVDENSGVGTQFVIQDVNGDKKQDIVTSNKNGVFLFLQK